MLPTLRTRPSTGPAFAPRAGAGPAPPGVVIPYEHGAVFRITGRPGNIVQDVITVSPEGVFVATAIGYGFDEDRGRPLRLAISNPTDPLLPGDLTLDEIPAMALIEGVRVNPAAGPMVFRPGAGGTVARDLEFGEQAFPQSWMTDNFLERVKDDEDISFFFSMLDSATGRELSDEPAHNIASLGKSNGERPFRRLSRPLAFAPRSTLRVQVIENSDRITGTLHVVFFGYRLLGLTACPEPLLRGWTAPAAMTSPAELAAGRDVIPFDYVMTFPLTGRAGNRVVSEIAVNVEGSFVADTIGYGLVPASRELPLLQAARRISGLVSAGQITLGDVPLSIFPPGALAEGIRVRPDVVRLAFDAGGGLARIPAAMIEDIFERLNQPEEVRFLYSLNDTGLGRDLQNRPIHNIAGLGIANGDRPFKRLAPPLVLAPRSALRAEIEERFGRGTLFLTFQGYKLLGAAPTGGLR
jgi:hypothetical protein